MQTIKLIPGASAYQWLRYERRIAAVSVPAAGAGILIAIVGSGASPAWLAVGVLLTLVGVLGWGLFTYSIPSTRRQRQEEAAGYTTVPTPHQPELDLVNPRTGFVVRSKGSREVTAEEFVRLIDLGHD